jgi:hypothetical protein
LQITIHTPTNGLSHSIDFYSKLGFKQLSDHPVIFTDGKALIEINPDRYARAGIKLYKDSWREDIELIEMLTPVTKTSDGGLFADPGGVYIYVSQQGPEIPFVPAKTSFGVLGNFAGLSLETTDLAKSAALYEALGFVHTSGSPEAGYLSLAAEGLDINLMRPLTCPHLFFNPSMTYFNGGNNMAVIGKIRSARIPIAEEITHFNKEGIVDNIIIRDPGGYGFFVFND